MSQLAWHRSYRFERVGDRTVAVPSALEAAWALGKGVVFVIGPQLTHAIAAMGDAAEPEASSAPVFIVTGFSSFSGVASNPTEQLVRFLQADLQQRGEACFLAGPA